MNHHGNSQSGEKEFPTTSWTLVVTAREPDSEASRAALAQLCGLYWYPLFAFIRRRGHAPDQAQDLTQEFFVRLLEKDGLRQVDSTRGRFRSFLLTCCKNFLANQTKRERAAKRSGDRPPLSIDLNEAERRFLREPTDRLGPEALFDRRWALLLVERARERLEEEYRSLGKDALMRPLLAALMGEPTAPAYAQVALDLGMSEAAVKKSAQRLRERFAIQLRRQVAPTVASLEEIDDEVRDLMAALGQ